MCGAKLSNSTALAKHVMSIHRDDGVFDSPAKRPISSVRSRNERRSRDSSRTISPLRRQSTDHRTRVERTPRGRVERKRSYSPEQRRRPSVSPRLDEDLGPNRRQRPETSQQRSGSQRDRKRSNKSKVLLCLRCGRRHDAPCRWPADVKCSKPSCPEPVGHIDSLHSVKNPTDLKILKRHLPGFQADVRRRKH